MNETRERVIEIDIGTRLGTCRVDGADIIVRSDRLGMCVSCQRMFRVALRVVLDEVPS